VKKLKLILKTLSFVGEKKTAGEAIACSTMFEVDDHKKSSVQWTAIELHGKREVIHRSAEEVGIC
jgi:hypothetical protein